MITKTKHERLEDANYAILQISMLGRRFFYNEKGNRVARFELSIDGKLWFVDDYTGKRVYTAYRGGRWRNFSHGGTMRAIIEALAEYIRTGARISSRHFGPWPEYYCEGDLWGYGKEAMAMLRNILRARDCIRWPSDEQVAA